MEEMMKEFMELMKELKGSIADLVYIELAKMPMELRKQIMSKEKLFRLSGEELPEQE